MDIFNVLEYPIGSVFLCLFFTISGQLFFQKKIPKTTNSLIIVLCLMLFITVNYMILDNVARLVTSYVFVMYIYKLLFKESTFKSAIAALVSYFLLVISEILLILILTALYELEIISNIGKYAGTISANVFICTVALLISLLIHKVVNLILIKIKEYYKISLVFTFTIILTAISSVFHKLRFNKWDFDYAYLLNIIIILCLVYIGFIVIKQHLDRTKISEDYEKYLEYSKQTEKLVEQYSISQHENKNELIIIKSMVHKNNRKLLEYLDEIISSKDNIEHYWIKNLKYIPFGGLKGIMHNKVSIMREKGINVFFNISKDVGKSSLKNLNIKENNQLSKIIGVFLDNATEAALLSDAKEVSVIVYVESKKVIFEISNSFVDTVDINKIYDSGISSKGKNRGYGLTLVRSIIDENKMFENETKIIDNYFVQILKVNIEKLHD